MLLFAAVLDISYRKRIMPDIPCEVSACVYADLCISHCSVATVKTLSLADSQYYKLMFVPPAPTSGDYEGISAREEVGECPEDWTR